MISPASCHSARCICSPSVFPYFAILYNNVMNIILSKNLSRVHTSSRMRGVDHTRLHSDLNRTAVRCLKPRPVITSLKQNTRSWKRLLLFIQDM